MSEDERNPVDILAHILLAGMAQEESQRAQRLPRTLYVYLYLGTFIFLYMFALHVSGVAVGIVDGSNACQADNSNRLQPWVLVMSAVALTVWMASIFLIMTGQLFPEHNERCNFWMGLMNTVGYIFFFAWSIWGCVLLANKNADCIDEPLGRMALALLVFWGLMLCGCIAMLPCLLSERCFLSFVKCCCPEGEEHTPLIEEEVAAEVA